MRKLYDQHHKDWSEECVETEDYTRYRALFDRTLPWREKEYRGYSNGRKSGNDALMKNYEVLTGRQPPK